MRAVSPSPEWDAKWTLENGVTVLVEESHVLPLVDIAVVIRCGALCDPPGKEGVARLAARMLRMGTSAQQADEVEEAIDAMGASLGTEVGYGSIRFHGSVIKRNMPAFLALLGELIGNPALREADFELARREMLADLQVQHDSDRWLVARAFRKHLLGGHPHARVSTEDSLSRIQLPDVAAFLASAIRGGNVLLGVAGDVEESVLLDQVGKAFSSLPAGATARIELQDPVITPGRRLRVIDKPERAQTQVLIGTLGIRLQDAEYYPLVVANTAFGGIFTSRLMREIRSERGWSYAASSRVGADRVREAWTVFTHPSAEQVADCIAVELMLIESFVETGIAEDELTKARDYLIKSHAFDRDTAAKRLEPRLDAELHGLPPSFFTGFADHVASVTLERANAAVRDKLSAEDLSIVVVATADAVWERLKLLERLVDSDSVRFETV